MELVRAFDEIDNVDVLSATHEPYEHHDHEKNVDIAAEQTNRVYHEESEEDSLSQCDNPNLLDLHD